MRAQQVWKKKGDKEHIYIVRIEDDIVFYRNISGDGNAFRPTLDGEDVEFETMSSKRRILDCYELIR